MNRSTGIALLLALVLAAGAQRPAAAHVTAEGLFLRVNGSLVVRVVGNQVTGALAMPDGVQTDQLDITFLDENGGEFVAPFPATLQWTINPVIASVTQVDDWSIRLTGENLGATALAVKIFFENHVDYTSPAIPVRVVGTTGVEDSSAENAPGAPGAPSAALSVWPNPCREELHLVWTTPAPTTGALRLLDVNGRVLQVIAAAEVSSVLSMRPLAAGSYWLQWQDTRILQTIRLVKLP